MNESFRKFLKDADVELAIAEVGEIARGAHYFPVLTGRVAMHAYGGDRYASRVEFIVRSVPSSFVQEQQLPVGGASGLTARYQLPVSFIVRNRSYDMHLVAERPRSGLSALVKLDVSTWQRWRWWRNREKANKI